MIIRTEPDLLKVLVLDSETEHVEFKEAKNRYEFEELVGYCRALANEGGGSIVLGVTDTPPRRIVGTAVFESIDRTKIGLFERLHWRVDIAEIVTSAGRVLSFIVPGRPAGRPLNYRGRYLMRAGSSLQPMSVDQIARILGETQVDFSADLVPGADVSVLDDEAIAAFRIRWQRKGGRVEIANWATGIIERTGRGKPILSRRFYSFLGETGVHTRKAGLHRETEKELLLKHLKSAEEDGAPMSELIQVLPGKNRDHIKRLLEQLRDDGRAHVIGSKRTARW